MTDNTLISVLKGVANRDACSKKCDEHEACNVWEHYIQICFLYEKFPLEDAQFEGMIAGPCSSTGE